MTRGSRTIRCFPSIDVNALGHPRYARTSAITLFGRARPVDLGIGALDLRRVRGQGVVLRCGDSLNRQPGGQSLAQQIATQRREAGLEAMAVSLLVR